MRLVVASLQDVREMADPAEAVDEREILRVVAASYAAVWAKDFEAFAFHHVQADYSRRWVWWLPGTLVLKEGWEHNAAHVRQVMAEMPDGVAVDVRRDNVNLRVGTDIAWVTFDQTVPDAEGGPIGIGGVSRELRILEKHDGQWKIAFHGAINRSMGGKPDRPTFRVDPEGRILWQNEAGKRELEGNSAIVIRNGRLTALDRKNNQALQKAFRWAVQHEGAYLIRRGAVAIFPEPAHEDEARVWWVASTAGAIFVVIADRHITDAQLAAAAALYGLSPAQSAVAAAIVAGKSLAVVASEAGVTLNTARTHLRRLFNKTGVRTRVALVRALPAIAPRDQEAVTRVDDDTGSQVG